MRGEALRRGDNHAWVPEKWAKFAFQCRGCSKGAKHAAQLGTKAPPKPGPNKPPPPTPQGRSGAQKGPRAPYRHCTCGQLFRSATHDMCILCRKRVRKRAVRLARERQARHR